VVTKVERGKTSETWLDRGSVEFVRVFVGRSHPLSFGIRAWFRDCNLGRTYG